MDPEIFKSFVLAFTEEWNRLQADAGAEIAQRGIQLEQVKRQITRLVDALMNGTPAAAVNDRLRDLEARRIVLEAEAANAVAPAPRIHPSLAEVYRAKVATLQPVLAKDDAAAARELVRGLVDAITMVPEDGKLRIEVRGALAGILALCGATNGKSPGFGAKALAVQIKMVAGTRSHLYRTHFFVR